MARPSLSLVVAFLLLAFDFIFERAEGRVQTLTVSNDDRLVFMDCVALDYPLSPLVCCSLSFHPHTAYPLCTRMRLVVTAQDGVHDQHVWFCDEWHV